MSAKKMYGLHHTNSEEPLFFPSRSSCLIANSLRQNFFLFFVRFLSLCLFALREGVFLSPLRDRSIWRASHLPKCC